MARFVNAQVAELVQPFWAALQRGEFITDAAAQVGTYRKQGTRWVATCGGVRPRRGRDLKGRCLSFSEREEIALARARGETIGVIARIVWVGRRRRSRASCAATPTAAAATGDDRARARLRARGPPQPAKLAVNVALRELVHDDLRSAIRPSRSPGACAASSLMTRRCGCLRKRSISRYTCNPGARCGAS